jgi:hypothetical protein
VRGLFLYADFRVKIESDVKNRISYMEYSKLFLARFPEEAEVIRLNKKRIRGFLRFTYEAQSKNVSSLKPKAAHFIAKLNNLGLITFDSQEGIYRKTKDPIHLSGEDKGEPYFSPYNKSKTTLRIYSERAYCCAFIRIDILRAFMKNLKKENQNIKIILHPYNGRYIKLTSEYFETEDGANYDKGNTGINPTTQEYVDWEIDNLEGDGGYYSGPYIEALPINSERWTYVTTIDMTFGHHALKYNGLFRCLERALITTLKN